MINNPIPTHIRRAAVSTGESEIKWSSKRHVSWKCIQKDSNQSVICCLQFFSDMKLVTLTTAALAPYPLHTILLKFFRKIYRVLITSGQSICWFYHILRPSSEKSCNESSRKKFFFSSTTKIKQAKTFASSSQRTHFRVRPWLDNVWKGSNVTPIDRKSFFCIACSQ